uniref:Reverse transcriptase domain-containing protein n=1 Tax=Tanacetum cinerariifolium TaxID=118510 RepID=A0A6L2LC86_TANCI|nr:reverse transcriptase domain-containing protein [Tanacetum cinerariifolium]
MADRTMEELLQAPTKGYGEAIVISEILAENFEIKTNLLQLVQANKFHGFERDNPHTHISNFKRMIATLKYRDVSNDAIKLMLFPYSLEGDARVWYEKEPPHLILTWDDLVNKFVNQFFPPSKTTHLKNEISRFTQRFDETFSDAWKRFKDLLRACPHHRFSELTQIDTFYNGLTEQHQDSLNATSGVEIVNKQVIALAKAVEKTCVTCGWAHAYYECIATDSNPSSVYAATGSYNQVSPPNRASHQIPPPGFALVQNNPNRFNQNQGQENYFNQANNFNQGNNFRGNNFLNNQGYRAQMNNASNFQNQGFQNQPFSVSNNQIPPSVPSEFSSYIKSNEIMIKSMQNQINVLRGDCNKQEENPRRNLNNDMRSILGSFFQNQPSTSGTLLSNTMPNPKGEMKAFITRSGLAYEGPSIPTESLLEKVDEQNTEEILDKEHSNSSGSTAQVQPPVVPISISKPDVLRTQTKPSIPYPSRLNDQKLREKATNQMEKNFQIFHDLHFDISFADALLLMPKFASTIKSLLANKDKLFELAKVSLNENCSAMLLKKLPEKLGDPELTPTRMTLELADWSITRPKGVAEDVFVKVGKFHFPTDFVVVDFKADPRVPLILGRSFLRTGRALIDVYGEEFTLRVNEESITFNLNQTMRYSLTYDDTSVNKVDVIDMACEEFVHDVLDFQYNPKSSSPTLVFDDLISESDDCKEPIVKSSSPTLTPFGESDFFLEEIEDFLNDDSIPTGIKNSVYDPKGDILFLEKLLNDDPFQLPPMDLKLAEESKEKSSVKEPPELDLKELPSHLEYAFLEDSNKLPVIIAKNLKVDEREALINPVVSPIHCIPKKGGMTVVANENNELIPIRLVTGWRVCIDYRKLNYATRKDYFPLLFMDQMLERKKLLSHGLMEPLRTDACPLACVMLQEFLKIARPMTHLLEKEKPFVFSKECIDAFNSLKKKLTEAPILVVPDWNLPFELMCDARDYAIGDVKPRLLRWVLLLQEFDITILDKKGSENLAADHLSRLENPYPDVLENKDINENFPLETLGSLTSHITSWFVDIIIRCYVHGKEAFEILKACHEGPSGGHHGANLTANKRTVGKNRTSWSDKLDDALWVFRTAYKTPIGCTPYKLVYGKSYHLPIKLEHRAYWALKHVNFDLKTAGDHRKLQLNELSELRDQAYENSVIYKERTKKLHDSKIKNRIFSVGDQVLHFNSRLKIFSGKLKTCWSGPFTITCVFPYGTIELS